MSSPEKKILEGVLAAPLKNAGFKKRGATWYRKVGNVIQVVNLQGSQWSKIFYINLGVYLTDLEGKEHPAEYDCHIRTRLSQLVPNREREAYLLDLHSKELEKEHETELIQLLIEHGLSWLSKCSEPEGLVSEISRRGSMVHHLLKARYAPNK